MLGVGYSFKPMKPPHLQVQKSDDGSFRTSGPIEKRGRGSIYNQGGRCRWFIAWVAHVVKNCWWQQKAVHYPHGFRNESHTAKRHEKKGVAQLRHYQKSVVWLWFLFWLVRERMFQKTPSISRRKVKTTFETLFNKANSLQGGWVSFVFSQHQSRCPCRNAVHMFPSKF